MRSVSTASDALPTSAIDLELIGQRILKLAEIATLEHLDSLMRSQADGLLNLMEEGSWAGSPDSGFERLGL